jgi:plasmid maintenance system antidote protein VapI
MPRGRPRKNVAGAAAVALCRCSTLSAILNGRAGVSPEMAVRPLAR